MRNQEQTGHLKKFKTLGKERWGRKKYIASAAGKKKKQKQKPLHHMTLYLVFSFFFQLTRGDIWI